MSNPLPSLNLPTDNISVVVDKLLPPKARFVVYAVFFVAAVVLIAMGLMSEGEAAMWLFFAGNILGVGGTGLATLNRPRKIEEGE